MFLTENFRTKIIRKHYNTRVAVKVRPDAADHEQPQFLPVPGESYALLFKKSPPQKSDDESHRHSGREARRIWLIEPMRELPLDTHVVLKTEPGLISALGPEAGVTSGEVVQFDTYPEFTFLGVKCTANDGKPLFTPAGQPPGGKCNPMQSVELSFSAPVERDKIGGRVTFNPPVGAWKQSSKEESGQTETMENTEAGARVGYQFRQPHSKGKTYEVWLPGGLKAAQEYTVQSRSRTMNVFERLSHWIVSWFTRQDLTGVQDIFGRGLRHAVSCRFATDHRNANFVMDYADAVLEKGVESDVPLFVNNLNDYTFNYRRLTAEGSDDQRSFHKDVPSVKDVQFAVPLGVRAMLDGRTGAVFGSLQTSPMVGKYHPRLFAQVTPYQVHLKLGHFNTIAWVTDMATGAPVAGAEVNLYQDAFTTLHAVKDSTARATTDARGVAVLPGTDTLDPDLSITGIYRDEDTRYFLRVRKGEDMALLPIAPSFVIDSYRSSGSESVYPSNKKRYGHMRAWGMTAQGIYRAGDTIQYKIYVRDQDNQGFIPGPEKGYRLKIIDPMDKVVHEVKDITLSPFGGISGEFAVPKEGAVGWYQFKLIADFADKSGNDEQDDAEERPEGGADGRNEEAEDDRDSATRKSWVPMRVLVSDFTPSSFRVSTQLNGDLFHNSEQVDVVTHAELHSGGAYTDASSRITAMLDSAPFLSGHPLAKNFQFDSYLQETPSQQLFQKIDKVNDKGELALRFSTGMPKVVYGKLLVESAVADDRGKYMTGQAHAEYVGVDRLVGLHPVE